MIWTDERYRSKELYANENNRNNIPEKIGNYMNKKQYAIGAYLLVLSISFGIAVCFYGSPNWYSSDSNNYFSQADAILSGKWVEQYPNGYPALIALTTYLFGENRDIALIFLNILMSSSLVLIVFWLTLEITKNTVLAFLAAMACTFWPTNLIYVRLFVSEVPAAFFLGAGIALIWIKRDAAGAGAIGIAACVRPTLLPVAFLVTGALLFRREPKRALIMVTIPLLVYGGMKAYGWSVSSDVGGDTNLARVLLLSLHNMDAWSDFRYQGETTTQALQIFAADAIERPLDFARRCAQRFWELWGPWPMRDLGRGGGPPRSIFHNALIGLQFPLFLLGCAAFAIRRDWLAVLLFAPTLTLTIVHTVILGYPRYNYPATPLLIVLAADAVAMVLQRFGFSMRQRRSGHGFHRAQAQRDR